jgi:hypothetical protein
MLLSVQVSFQIAYLSSYEHMGVASVACVEGMWAHLHIQAAADRAMTGIVDTPRVHMRAYNL